MALVLSASLTNVTIAQENNQYWIRSIVVEIKDIFDVADSTENHWLGRIVNGLHFSVRENIIHQELLFKEGDPFSQVLVDESERNLRRMGIIGDISTKINFAQGDSVDIIIAVHEKWTLNTSASYKQEGGKQYFGLSLTDDNFLGSAQHLTLGYNYISDRTKRDGFEFIFSESRLFKTRWQTTFQYKNSEDLFVKTLLFHRPYFSEDASWAASLYGETGNWKVREYKDGVVKNQEIVTRKNFNFWLSSSTGTREKFRVGVAYTHNRSRSKVLSTSSDNIDLLSVSFGLFKRDYYRDSFLDNLGRIEDVSYGYSANLILGKNMVLWGADSPKYFLRFVTQYSNGKQGQYFHTDLSSVSYFREKPFETTFSANLLYHNRLNSSSTLVGRFNLVLGSRWSNGRQLVLGSQSGLRGYFENEFSGQRSILFSIENRVSTDINLFFFRLGAVIFCDWGTAWESNSPITGQKFHGSAGIGIRIENTKQQGSGITRIDIPFSFDKRKIFEIIISTNQLFRAFGSIDTPPPNVLH